MTPIVILALLVALPILGGLLFRVHSALLFVSILSGDLLLRFLSDDVAFAISAFVPSQNVPLVSQAITLLTPLVLTIFILKHSITKNKILLHLLPIVGCGIMLAILALPMLPSQIQSDIFATTPGEILRTSQDVIIGVTVLLVLLVTWQSFYHRPDKHAKHGKH